MRVPGSGKCFGGGGEEFHGGERAVGGGGRNQRKNFWPNTKSLNSVQRSPIAEPGASPSSKETSGNCYGATRCIGITALRSGADFRTGLLDGCLALSDHSFV